MHVYACSGAVDAVSHSGIYCFYSTTNGYEYASIFAHYVCQKTKQTPLLRTSWPVQDGSVTNIAQAVGDKLYVTVDGQGTPASMSTELPYEVHSVLSTGSRNLVLMTFVQ